MPSKTRPARTGLWLIGARGGLATTLISGLHLIRRGLISRCGLLTEGPTAAGLDLPSLDDLVIGGHDIRSGSVYQSALDIYHETGTIPFDKLALIKDDLALVDEEIRFGIAANCGDAIRDLAESRVKRDRRPLLTMVRAIAADIAAFRERHQLRDVIVVNLASTEPPLDPSPADENAAALQSALRRNRRTAVRASTLYTLAAFEAGCPYINFTPSNAALTPALQEIGLARGLPYVGSDGKTGETLVKSALAPMFRYRSLQVLSWQGYNMLGDRDGLILSNPANRSSKIRTKDSVLSNILGYPLHTHVAIDYVPSLADLKTAWDFVHFQGFLDFKMSMQFTWQGCDAVLAAPLVIDLARFAALAHRRGERGPMTHLACFFKNPLGVPVQDLHLQFQLLLDYIAARGPRKPRRTAPRKKR